MVGREGGIGRNRKQSRPVPDAELEGVGAAVGAGAEGVDAPLRQAGDGLHAGVRPARPSGPAAVHRRRRATAAPQPKGSGGLCRGRGLTTEAKSIPFTNEKPFFLSPTPLSSPLHVT